MRVTGTIVWLKDKDDIRQGVHKTSKSRRGAYLSQPGLLKLSVSGRLHHRQPRIPQPKGILWSEAKARDSFRGSRDKKKGPLEQPPVDAN